MVDIAEIHEAFSASKADHIQFDVTADILVPSQVIIYVELGHSVVLDQLVDIWHILVACCSAELCCRPLHTSLHVVNSERCDG